MKRMINTIFMILYLVILLGILFLGFVIGGRGQLWSDLSLRSYIIKTSNFVPFATIGKYFRALIHHDMNIDIPIKNLLGNFVMFMPFAYFVFYFKKYRLSKFVLILFVLLVVIEIMQSLLRVGFFDVDDIILNALGALLIYWILESMHSRRVR